MKSKVLFGSSLAVAGLYLFIGCTSTTTGNEGNLDFSYTADDDVTNFNKPIAVGAKLELKVLETGSRLPVEVIDAMSDDTDVLDVETFSSNRVILVGAGDGSAAIEVSAEKQDGEVVTDSVNMLSAVPDVLKLGHTCTAGDALAKYFVDTEDVHISFDMEKENGQPVIGYGYFPIEVTGDAELDLDRGSTDQANFHFNVGQSVGTATIQSTVDDTTLDVEVVLPGDVDAIESNPTSDFQLHVGETEFYHFWPTVQGVRVCQSHEEVQAESSTPSICAVSAVAPPEDDETASGLLGVTGWVKIEGKEFGTCQFTVTYPNANTGQGVTQEFEAEVGEFPSSNNSTDETM